MDTKRQSSSSSSLGSTSVSSSSSSMTSIGPRLNNHDSLNRSPSSLSTSAISHDGISRKRKSKRSASHTHSVKNRRVYSESEIQDKIARNNYTRGRPSTTGFSTPHNLACPSTSSGSRSLLLDHFSLSQNTSSISSCNTYEPSMDMQQSHPHLNAGGSQESFRSSVDSSTSLSNICGCDETTNANNPTATVEIANAAYNPPFAIEVANLDHIFRLEQLSTNQSPVDGSQLQSNDFILETVDIANVSIKECFDILDTGRIPLQPLSENVHIQKCQKQFLDTIYHQKQSQKFTDSMFHCTICKERWLTPSKKIPAGRSSSARGRGVMIYQCNTCASQDKAKEVHNGIRLFSAENDMDPLDPNHIPFHARYEYLLLPKLNEISQMLIARVYTYMKVFRIQGGGTRYEGKHYVYFHQSDKNT